MKGLSRNRGLHPQNVEVEQHGRRDERVERREDDEEHDRLQPVVPNRRRSLGGGRHGAFTR